MPGIEALRGSYYFHVRRIGLTEHVTPRRSDILRFDVTVTLQYLTEYRRVRRASTLFETSIPITCESFFENNHDFLRGSLSNPSSYPYFTPESLDQITQEVIPTVQQLFEVQSFPSSDNTESADLECQEFSLNLDIFVDVPEDEESEDGEEFVFELERVEESMPMQQFVTMIPASNEAIQSLETFTDSLFVTIENCNICMEEFHAEEGDEDVKFLSSMPCGHVFHHQCIVKWLQTSHMCPLCRYAMPTG